MNRRGFLLLRTRGRERVMELSCQRLYLRWADARSRAGAAVAAEPGVHGAWEGEPPTEIAVSTVAEVLAEVERGLAQADVLRLADVEWLSDLTFREEVESCIEAFRERGGSVE